ncbi:MAG: hypothetical protein HQK51_12140 [Oligoflexia bacterium]|nr:hypothetical protein [Oligoflexia bacterium]
MQQSVQQSEDLKNLNGLYYLVVDQELKVLLEKFAKHHPESSKGVLKLIIKMYLKLVDKSKRKGRDPLVTFENLVETLMTGKLCETTRDKIEYLDSILEEKNAIGAASNYVNSSVTDDIKEIKSLIKEIKNSALVAGIGTGLRPTMDNFCPKGPSELIELQPTGTDGNNNNNEQKKRKNFKDIRKDKANKIVKF